MLFRGQLYTMIASLLNIEYLICFKNVFVTNKAEGHVFLLKALFIFWDVVF